MAGEQFGIKWMFRFERFQPRARTKDASFSFRAVWGSGFVNASLAGPQRPTELQLQVTANKP